MAALWTVEYVGGAIRVRRHRSQADAEAYRDAVLHADGRFLTRCTVGSGEARARGDGVITFVPSERLRAKYERLVADEESTQSDYDKLYEELSAYSDTLTTEQLMDWFIDLNDPETISGWTERIEAHNAYIDVMEPNNAVLRNPLDVDSTFHIRIYDYFIDFHEDREIVDDLEFTPSDVEADDWTEDIKRCLEENGWRLDSKIGTDSDDSDLLVFDCVKA